MVNVLNNNYDLKPILYFVLGVFFGFVFSLNVTSVSAQRYYYGDSENDFNDAVNSMTEFTTLNSIYSDTSYIDSPAGIRQFISSCDYTYLVSYYNGGLDPAKTYKSVDLYCLPASVSMNPVYDSNNHSLTLVFEGFPGESFVYRDRSNIFARNVRVYFDDLGHASVLYTGRRIVRSIFDISHYYDFDQSLPNFFMAKSFTDTHFISNLFNSANSFGWYIALMVSLFIFLYIINKKLGLGLGFNYKGGVKL